MNIVPQSADPNHFQGTAGSLSLAKKLNTSLRITEILAAFKDKNRTSFNCSYSPFQDSLPFCRLTLQLHWQAVGNYETDCICTCLGGILPRRGSSVDPAPSLSWPVQQSVIHLWSFKKTFTYLTLFEYIEPLFWPLEKGCFDESPCGPW